MSRRLFGRFFTCFLFLAAPVTSFASDNGEIFPTARVWHTVTFDAPVIESAVLVIPEMAPPPVVAEQRPTAFEYSNFYNTRRKIHMLASWATIPLFIGEYVAGEKLYDGNGSESARSAHGALTAGLAGIFGLNTVTGVWNMWDGRKDPNGRTRRLVHTVMMLGANAGFLATASLAPDDDDGGGFSSDRSAHRNMAIASMGVATGSYIYMLVTR